MMSDDMIIENNVNFFADDSTVETCNVSSSSSGVNIIKMKVAGFHVPISIDVSMIKTSPFLVGANVLKSLFCVSDDCVLEQTLTEDDNHNFNLLENYDIGYFEWLCLQRFIRSGILPKDDQALDCLQFTAEKLGGIPSLDGLLSIREKKMEEKRAKIIRNPYDDVENRYMWGFFDKVIASNNIYAYQNFLTGGYKSSNGWSVASANEKGVWFCKERESIPM